MSWTCTNKHTPVRDFEEYTSCIDLLLGKKTFLIISPSGVCVCAWLLRPPAIANPLHSCLCVRKYLQSDLCGPENVATFLARLVMKSKPLSLFSKDSCLESNIQRERDHLFWAFQLSVRLTKTTAHKNRTDLSLCIKSAAALASNNLCANGKVSVSCGSALTLGSPFRDACKGWPCLISVMRIVPSAGPVCNHCNHCDA